MVEEPAPIGARRRRAPLVAGVAMLVIASVIAVWLLVGDDGSELDHREQALCRALVEVGDHPWADIDVSVFLNPDATAAERADVVAWVEDQEGVVRTRFIDQEEAYEEFVELYADSPEMIAAIEADDLPPSIRVEFEPGAERLNDVEGRPGVYRVVDRADTFPDGIRPVDVLLRPLATGRVSGALYSMLVSPHLMWRGYEIDHLVDVAPDDLAADLETIQTGLDEWEGAVLPREVEPAAARVVHFFDTTCEPD